MTSLRQRMIDDMRLAGFAERTRDVYIQAVRPLAAHYMRSPDVLSEEEVRAYLLHLRDERGGAWHLQDQSRRNPLPLFEAARSRLGTVLQKKALARRGSSGCRSCCPMSRSAPS
jgi:hypothetical protein